MVIEAVFEDINIKHAVVKEVEAVSVTEKRLSRMLERECSYIVNNSLFYLHM